MHILSDFYMCILYTVINSDRAPTNPSAQAPANLNPAMDQLLHVCNLTRSSLAVISSSRVKN